MFNDKRVTITGDIAKGTQFLPFARSQVDKLYFLSKNLNNVNLERKFKVTSDVDVTVSVRA
jgi:hypothetical protein